MIDDRTLERVMPRPLVALTGDLVRATAWMLVAVGLITFAGVYARLASLLLARPASNDFSILYYTARMAGEGRPMYGPLPPEYGLGWQGAHLGNLNPPHLHLLMAPLVPLGYRGALAAWLAANLAIVVVTAWIGLRACRPRLTPRRVLLTALLVFASAAWTSVAATGEMSLLLLLPFTGAWIAARRGRWEVAGALLGLAASVKLFLLVFAAWLLVARRWRAVGSMAAAGIAPVLAGAIVYGPGSYVEWVRGLSRVGWWWLPMNVSLRGTLERLLAPPRALAAVADAPALVHPVWLAAALAVVAITAWRTWPSGPVDADRLFATLLLAALLVSPLGWVYYLPLATGPLLALAARGELAGPGTLRLAVAAVGLGLLYMPMELAEKGQPSPVATLVLACAHGWGVILLWTRLVLAGRGGVRPAAA